MQESEFNIRASSLKSYHTLQFNVFAVYKRIANKDCSMAIVLVVEIYTFFCPKGAAYFMDVLPPKGQWVGCGDLYS